MLMLCRYLTIPARFDEHSWRRAYFQLSTLRNVSFKKKVEREANEEELESS
jgi:hypothetical protein